MCSPRRHVIFWVLFFLCVISAAPALSAELQSIRISANSALSSRELLGWFTLKPGLPFSETALRNDITAVIDNLRRLGYLGAQVAVASTEYTADSSFVAVNLDVREGRRSVISSVRCAGQRVLAEEDILQQFEAAPGDPLDAGVLEQDIDVLLARYERHGLPLASCRVRTVESRAGTETDSLALLLEIDEGDPVTIDEIRVAGNQETRSSVVVRETRVSPGELYNPAKVDAIRTRLNRLNIFSSVEEPQLYMRDSVGGLLITVREGNTSTFDGVVGYVPGAGAGETGYFTGLVSVGMRNLFGTGRKLNVRWLREDRNSQELGLRYVEPWIFGAPVNVGAGFLQRQQDSSYVHRTIDGQADLMLSEKLSVGVLVRSEKVIPSADSLRVSTTRPSSTSAVGASVLFDTRDDIANPTSGARYRVEYTYGRKRLSSGSSPVPLGNGTAAAPAGSGTAAVQRLMLDLDFYLPVFTRQVIALGLHGYEVRGGAIQESDMFRFGGATTLRGYRENQFLGARVAWGTAEYRFLLGRRSFLFGFLDGGYYSRPDDPERALPASDAFKHGYGIGLRTDTPLGNISVSFALGQGDSFSMGKIHIGLINDF